MGHLSPFGLPSYRFVCFIASEQTPALGLLYDFRTLPALSQNNKVYVGPLNYWNSENSSWY